METACQYGSKSGIYDVSRVDDVTIQITMDGEEPQLGADAKLSVTMKNTSAEQRTFNLHSQVAVIYYTGVYKSTVKKDQIPIELQPNEGERSYQSAIMQRLIHVGLLMPIRD